MACKAEFFRSFEQAFAHVYKSIQLFRSFFIQSWKLMVLRWKTKPPRDQSNILLLSLTTGSMTSTTNDYNFHWTEEELVKLRSDCLRRSHRKKRVRKKVRTEECVAAVEQHNIASFRHSLSVALVRRCWRTTLCKKQELLKCATSFVFAPTGVGLYLASGASLPMLPTVGKFRESLRGAKTAVPRLSRLKVLQSCPTWSPVGLFRRHSVLEFLKCG